MSCATLENEEIIQEGTVVLDTSSCYRKAKKSHGSQSELDYTHYKHDKSKRPQLMSEHRISEKKDGNSNNSSNESETKKKGKKK